MTILSPLLNAVIGGRANTHYTEENSQPLATTSSSPARRFCSSQVFATKKLSLFDNRGDLIGNHLLPAGLSALDLTQNILRENVHNRRIGSNDRCDKMIFEKMSVKIA